MEQKKTEKAPVVKEAEEFVKAYQDLCEKYGYQIVVTPAFKSRDDGTFSVVLSTSVGKMPKSD